jgi:hypothetical protein
VRLFHPTWDEVRQHGMTGGLYISRPPSRWVKPLPQSDSSQAHWNISSSSSECPCHVGVLEGNEKKNLLEGEIAFPGRLCEQAWRGNQHLYSSASKQLIAAKMRVRNKLQFIVISNDDEGEFPSLSHSSLPLICPMDPAWTRVSSRMPTMISRSSLTAPAHR